MNLLALPNDLLYYITKFLSISDKMTMRETNKEVKNNVKFMDIRVGKMDAKIEKLLNGRMYILCRLRLAALCGLHEHTVANIWAWATLLDDVKTDSLPILRQIGSAIYNKSIMN
jgi:hypothetical protein